MSTTLPLIFRKISGTDYYDATSVYGYAGPIEKRGSYFEQSAFKNELHQFLFKHKVISVFSRLHPYIDGQSHTLKDLGEICFHNLVVNIDLTQTLDEQRSRFNKRLKTYINKARRECSVIEATTTQHIQEFAAMYNENMLRVGAEKTYFFDEQYFIDLLKKGKIRFPWKSYEYMEWLIDHCVSMEIKQRVVNGQPIKKYVKGSAPNDGLMALMYAYMAYKFDLTKGFTIKPGFEKKVAMPTPVLANIKRRF